MESYDEPPPGRQPDPLVPAGTEPPAAGQGPPGFPPRDWPSWTLIPPCLLTVLVAAVGILWGLAAEAFYGVGADTSSGDVPLNRGWIFIAMAGGVIAMVATLVLAKSSLPRRVATLTAWGIVSLQVAWILLAFRLAYGH